jgi:hypothetical protein
MHDAIRIIYTNKIYFNLITSTIASIIAVFLLKTQNLARTYPKQKGSTLLTA